MNERRRAFKILSGLSKFRVQCYRSFLNHDRRLILKSSVLNFYIIRTNQRSGNPNQINKTNKNKEIVTYQNFLLWSHEYFTSYEYENMKRGSFCNLLTVFILDCLGKDRCHRVIRIGSLSLIVSKSYYYYSTSHWFPLKVYFFLCISMRKLSRRNTFPE